MNAAFADFNQHKKRTSEGHVALTDELLEHVAKSKLTWRQKLLYIFLLRESHGWQRATTKHSAASTLAEKLGMVKTHVSADLRAIQKLGLMTVYKPATGTTCARYRILKVAEMGFPDERQSDRNSHPTKSNVTEMGTKGDRNSHPRVTETVTPGCPKQSPFNKEQLKQECSKGELAYKSPPQNIGTIQNQRLRNQAEAAWASTTMRSASEAIRLWKAGRFSNVRRAYG